MPGEISLESQRQSRNPCGILGGSTQPILSLSLKRLTRGIHKKNKKNSRQRNLKRPLPRRKQNTISLHPARPSTPKTSDIMMRPEVRVLEGKAIEHPFTESRMKQRLGRIILDMFEYFYFFLCVCVCVLFLSFES